MSFLTRFKSDTPRRGSVGPEQKLWALHFLQLVDRLRMRRCSDQDQFCGATYGPAPRSWPFGPANAGRQDGPPKGGHDDYTAYYKIVPNVPAAVRVYTPGNDMICGHPIVDARRQLLLQSSICSH